jgi:hypothetical protein
LEEGSGSLTFRERERERRQDEGSRSKVSARSAPNPSHSTKMLGKMPLAKKLMRKISCPRARFNSRLELSGWLRKEGTALTLG